MTSGVPSDGPSLGGQETELSPANPDAGDMSLATNLDASFALATGGDSVDDDNSTPPPVADQYRDISFLLDNSYGASEDPSGDDAEPSPPRPVDPLVALILRNATESPLLRLTDDLLLCVMEQLDPVGLYALHHTSRTFMRLFSSSAFSSLHSQGTDPRLRFPWIHFAGDLEPSQGQQLLRLVAAARCTPCRRVRESPLYEDRMRQLTRHLDCDACPASHPAFCFSATERQPGVMTRRCLAHEGFIRICAHYVISLRGIRRCIRDLRKRQRDRTVLFCDQCRLPVCDEAAADPEPPTRPKRYLGVPGVRLAWHGRCCTLTVSWLAHGLRWARRERSLAAYAERAAAFANGTGLRGCGHHRLGDGFWAAAFDPNACACLDYPGRHLVDWQLRPAAELGAAPTALDCRARRERKPAAESRSGVHSRCCDVCGGNVQFIPCGRRSEHLDVLFRRSLGLDVSGKKARFVYADLMAQLDPASLGLGVNPDSKHLLWCNDERCANFRYAPFFRLLRENDLERPLETE